MTRLDRHLWGLGFVLFSVAATWAIGREGVQSVVKLPPFAVTEMPERLDWCYGKIGGIEVLSLGDDEVTREFLEGQWKGTLFLPATSLQDTASPVQVVIWGGENTPLAPTRKHSYYESGYNFGLDHPYGWFIPNIITADDGDTLMLSANLQNVSEYEKAAIHLARWRMQSEAPAFPRWIKEGLAGDSGVFPGDVGIQAYARNHRATGDILLPRLPWPADAASELIPLRHFFLGSPDLNEENKEAHLWRAQAGLLVRWALFGPELREERTRALWALAEVARYRPITEEDFRAVFGMGFIEAEQQLAKFRDVARWDSPRIRIEGFERDLPQFEHFKLRRATEGEVARLRGNFERIEMDRWRATAPEIAAKYEAAARRTLKRGLRLASDDPQVRAVFGLLEYETGHPNEARPHLEAAFGANAAGTSALLALARLRLADMRIGLPSDGTLPEEALDRVLTPLFVAKDRRPAVAEVYRLIGEVWAQSRAVPRKGHLAVLLEGIRLFPDDADLLWRAAELHQRHGYADEAIAIARRAETIVANLEARKRFASLRGALERGQPAAATKP